MSYADWSKLTTFFLGTILGIAGIIHYHEFGTLQVIIVFQKRTDVDKLNKELDTKNKEIDRLNEEICLLKDENCKLQ